MAENTLGGGGGKQLGFEAPVEKALPRLTSVLFFRRPSGCSS